ncbi:hypothetical protein [Xenorhabdus vietnamensis]|uniref:hypothetical protein n=1 Tax=Xenorhabdus vietnamensis TaxID=351656 RepID=UPI00142DAE11|nr:hypothetical protein [Xenorhabdus vietnamensis]
MTFSIGAISEAQVWLSTMLTPLHQAISTHLKQSAVIHIDVIPPIVRFPYRVF